MSKSIMQDRRECFVCGDTRVLHKHHIYGGLGRREISEQFGCWVYLCPRHHNMSDAGVHFNKRLDRKLKEMCQWRFEQTHTREDWYRYFGRSYLDDIKWKVEE